MDVLGQVGRHVRILARAIFVRPIELLYRLGPTWLGFWQGSSNENVCYELTAVEAAFWSFHEQQCAELIEKHFTSFLVVVYAAMVLISLYTALHGLWQYFFVIRPMTRNQDRLLDLLSLRSLKSIQ